MEKEEAEEESDDDCGDEKLMEEEFIKKYLEEDGDDEVPVGADIKRKIQKSLKEILKELDGQRMKVADIIHAIDEAQDTDKLLKTSCTEYHRQCSSKEKFGFRGMDV